MTSPLAIPCPRCAQLLEIPEALARSKMLSCAYCGEKFRWQPPDGIKESTAAADDASSTPAASAAAAQGNRSRQVLTTLFMGLVFSLAAFRAYRFWRESAAEQALYGPYDATWLSNSQLELYQSGQDRPLDLVGIEPVYPDDPGFDEARRALESLVAHRSVSVEFETTEPLVRVSDGGLTGYAIVDGRNVNVELTRQGWNLIAPADIQGRFGSELLSARLEAEAQHRGVWGMPGAVDEHEKHKEIIKAYELERQFNSAFGR